MVGEHCDEGEERISPLLRSSNLQDGLIVFGLAVLFFLLLPTEAASQARKPTSIGELAT